MVFKLLKKDKMNPSRLLKLLKEVSMKLKRKSTKSKKISSTSLVIKLLKSKRNLMLSESKLTNSKLNSKLIFPILMMTILELNKSWKVMLKLMNTISNYKNLNNKLKKTLNSKTCFNLKEETINLWKNVYLTWKTWKLYGIWFPSSISNTMIGKPNSGDKSKLMF